MKLLEQKNIISLCFKMFLSVYQFLIQNETWDSFDCTINLSAHKRYQLSYQFKNLNFGLQNTKCSRLLSSKGQKRFSLAIYLVFLRHFLTNSSRQTDLILWEKKRNNLIFGIGFFGISQRPFETKKNRFFCFEIFLSPISFVPYQFVLDSYEGFSFWYHQLILDWMLNKRKPSIAITRVLIILSVLWNRNFLKI